MSPERIIGYALAILVVCVVVYFLLQLASKA